MEITKRAPAFLSHVSISGYDSRIILRYATFAMVALIGIYLASGGSGMSEADLAIAAVLP